MSKEKKKKQKQQIQQKYHEKEMVSFKHKKASRMLPMRRSLNQN